MDEQPHGRDPRELITDDERTPMGLGGHRVDGPHGAIGARPFLSVGVGEGSLLYVGVYELYRLPARSALGETVDWG